MKLAFEKSIKNSLHPVRYNRSTKSMDFENKVFRFSTTYKKNFNFGINHIMMINILNDLIKEFWFLKINGSVVPKDTKNHLIYENVKLELLKEQSVEDYLTKIYNNTEVLKQYEDHDKTVSYEQLMNRYSFLHKIIGGPVKLINTLEQINQSLFNYKFTFKYLEKNKYPRFLKFSTMNLEPGQLFSFLYCSTKDIKGRHRDLKLKFLLNTFLSYIMFFGIRGSNIDYVSEQIYTMNISEQAKLFYIFFICGNKSKEPIRLTEIMDRVKITYTTFKQAEGLITNILEELKNNKLINTYDKTDDAILYRRFIIDSNNCDFDY